MPKISIIIPVYNVEAYLAECLDSVLQQTLQDIEVICINDGSPDGSLNILRDYEKKDARVVVIDKKNEGVGKTRNLGIQKAQGEFVAFMDPDDFYPEKDVLAALYNAAKENDVLICGGEFAHFRYGVELEKTTHRRLLGYYFATDSKIDYRDYQFDFGYHRFIYNRSFLIENDIYYPNYKRYQDPPFFVNAMIQAGSFYAIHKVTYGYRVGHNSVKWTDEKTADLLRGIRDVIMFARRHQLERLEQLQIERLTLDYFRAIEGSFGKQSFAVITELCQLSMALSSFFLEKILNGIKLLRNNNIAACAWRYPTYSRRFRYYNIMSKLTFGKRKKHYLYKKKIYKQLLCDIRAACQRVTDARSLPW